jgi:hypothetical protein
MKIFCLIFGLVLISLTTKADEKFRSADVLVVYKDQTEDVRNLLVRGEPADQIYETLLKQGARQEQDSLESTVIGKKMSCTRFLSNGVVIKILCNITIE